MDKDSDYSKKERLCVYLKKLQGPGENIRHTVDLNRKTIDSDLRTLEDGFELHDWKIKIPPMEHGRTHYGDSKFDLNDSTFHPLFFCLNLSELFPLVEAVKKSRHEVKDDLMKMIFKQLSPYAKDKLISQYPDLELYRDTEWELRARQESEVLSEKNIETFYAKPGRKVELILKDGRRLQGKICSEQEPGFMAITDKEDKTERILKAQVLKIAATS